MGNIFKVTFKYLFFYPLGSLSKQCLFFDPHMSFFLPSGKINYFSILKYLFFYPLENSQVSFVAPKYLF